MRLCLLAAVLVAFALPGVAHAGDVAMRVQDVPLGARSLAATPPAIHFNMLALHWQGTGTVLYRTRCLHGGWRPWTAADADDGPTAGGWHDGDLDWVGASARVQYRIRGHIRRLRAYELWSRVTGTPTRTLSEASSPRIVPRSGWHANEEIVRAKPQYAPSLRLAIVHHTAGTNDYTPAQAAAIVRGIEVYHVKGNGWNDIGYNFLVDRYGTVYEGRGGGMTRNVIGAHAEGFNTGSVGVALIGNFEHVAPTKAQQDALVKLLAWRLDLAHLDPLARTRMASLGNPKYRRGRLVELRTISGHRDTGPTECPGAVAYRLLPSIAKRVAATGLPKLYSPVVTGAAGGPIRFRARLTSSLAWTVTVADGSGKMVASRSGRGSLVDWTWDAPRGNAGYRWTIAAPGLRPATGTIGKPSAAPPPSPPAPPAPPAVPPTVSGVAVTPGYVSPAGGLPATVEVDFTLAATAPATVRVVAGGRTVVSLANGTLPAGSTTIQFDASDLADGSYEIVVAPRGVPAASVPLTVDRTLTGLAASSTGISPNADGAADSVSFSFALGQPASVQLTIQQNGTTVAAPFAGQLPAGPASIGWDGTGTGGATLPQGQYTAVVGYQDPLGSFTQTLPIAVDLTPPVLTVVDPEALVFSLSEPAAVTFVVDGGAPIVQPEPAGTFTLPYQGTVTSFSAQAVDGAGNKSAPVSG